MPRSTKILIAASLTGIPIWMLPDARAALGNNLFAGLVAIAFTLFLAGITAWYCDGK
jgi:hypothetical protein